jgi:hypothetical protein
MSITINLSRQIEEKLKSITTQNGMALEDYIEQLIAENIEESVSKEDELLLKINQGISTEKWKRFHELKGKRQAETLTEAEHQELIKVYSEIEEVHAQRLLYLVELAELKNVDIHDLMDELGIKNTNS